MQAFREPIAATTQEMDEDMQAGVRRDGVESDRTTGNFVAAKFMHLTSLPVNGLPDPQLLCHLFASKVTYDAVEQQSKSPCSSIILPNGLERSWAKVAHWLSAVKFANRS
ncbi:MAG: hypothetical protein JNM18_08710 [Planctomycetaceae bacterium]|nr:hypothetical protein [Planctomycetaceae bacterium]